MTEKSIRNKKVTNLIRNELISIIHKDLSDPRLLNPNFISIPHIDLSKDYRNATVYISILDINKCTEKRKKDTVEVLNSASNYMTYLLLKRLHIRTIPKMIFRYYDGFDNMSFIEELSRSIFEKDESSYDPNQKKK